MTLNTIQTLYERKLTTYPRVDTQFLSDDIYPKCPQIMNGLFQTTFAGKKPYADSWRFQIIAYYQLLLLFIVYSSKKRFTAC